MTNEEREKHLDWLYRLKSEIFVFMPKDWLIPFADALDVAIKALEQEPRKGHWIPTYGNVKCSVCGSVKDSRDVGKATHYCDFCGCRMVEPQKSEDKE